MKFKKFYLIIFIVIYLSISACLNCFADDFQAGVEAYSERNYTYAESCFRKALKNNSSNSTVRYYLATTLAQNRKYDEARRHYAYILSTDKNTLVARESAKALRNMGVNVAIPSVKSSSSASASKNKTVLDVGHDGNVIFVNNVILNNSQRAKLIVDTGATITVISTSLAKKLGINTVRAPRTKLSTANGVVSVPLVTIKSISINGLSAENVNAAVHDIDPNTDGLLGISFLKNFKFTMDKRNGKLILEK